MSFLRLPGRRRACRESGFTLAELVVATGIAALVVGGSIYGYVTSARRAEWSSYSLSAQALAMQRLEQARAAKWDPLGFPPVDELVSTNFPVQTNTLDIPISGTNVVYATNFTAITVLQTDPPLKMVRVDCVWPFLDRGVFTNTVATYRAPDQ